MGYSFGWNSKKELIEYLTKSWGKESINTVIAHSCVGNILWSVIEQHHTTTGTRERFIACTILSGAKGDWGYKGIDESSHPFYYTCPLHYLELVPVVACEEWRAKVREHWNGLKAARIKNSALTSGSRITLPESWSVRHFTLKEKVKNTWTAYGPDGRLYRLPLKAIQQGIISE